MSKLEELIEKLCPNGVEFKELQEICNVSIGEFVHKNKQREDAIYPVFNGGISNTGFYDEYNNEGNKVLVSARGANAGFVNKIETRYWAGNSCYSIAVKDNEYINWLYVYYFLKNNEKNLLGQQQTGSIPAISKKQIESFKIAVPPLEVQCEIVHILDDFTLLSAELSAELKARQQQYEYYRDKLINEGYEKEIPLNEVCEIKGRIGFRGYTRNDLVEKGNGAISFSPGNISNETINYEKCTYVSWEKYEESPEIMINNNDILLCKTGSTLGKVAQVKDLPEKATINPQLVVLKNIKCDASYLRFILGGYYFQAEMQSKKGLGSVPNITQKDIGEIKIKLHNREKQKQIAECLEKLDSLCNDISEGLPAEIEARRKQYEYYRDKLLTFKELKVEE